MQLGVRWRAGDPPHSSVPASLHEAIAEQESAHPTAHSWTLTWLEGRPRCELDDLVLIALGADGRISLGSDASPSVNNHLSDDGEDDDWLT